MAWLINAAQADRFRKSQKSLIILDASLHMPTEERDAKQEFLAKHISGAQFFDIHAFSDTQSALPHTLIRDEQAISQKLGEMGIRSDYKIIFYDNSNLHSSYRALWMMKIFGHNSNQLYILDGGLAAWEKFKGKTEAGPSTVTPKKYSAHFNASLICELAQVKEYLHSPHHQIIDVRHPVRFAGGKEIRPGVRPGHIPGSISFPFTELFEKTGYLKPLDKIRTQLAGIGINLKMPIVATCGSGVTATILDFVLELIGHSASHVVYDGSWTEWGSEKLFAGEVSLAERPVETSLEEVGEE